LVGPTTNERFEMPAVAPWDVDAVPVPVKIASPEAVVVDATVDGDNRHTFDRSPALAVARRAEHDVIGSVGSGWNRSRFG
jgi:hypothetical protein